MLPALAAIMACMLTACSASQPGAQGTPSAEEGAAAASEAQETGTETSLTETSLTGEEASQTEAPQTETSQAESTDIRNGKFFGSCTGKRKCTDCLFFPYGKYGRSCHADCRPDGRNTGGNPESGRI